ncbi:bucentaur or craniofacial development-domain-containing protein [Aspergillus coremiiformis]|uniref:SWR1-complex protein 5 n=1 Tax=Aspergillus coremiiformis TaxID=138285 RepID=A0A5N6YZN3_9EURO|nr:bucentaur or craniofacial development-domain-containing protein [Aspergillus coremiiformis]
MSANPATALDLDLVDEQYDSADDEDFQLDAAQDDGEITSDSDGEAAEPATKKRKTRKKEPEQGDNGLDSGDEATIQKAKSKKNKKQKGKTPGKDDEDEDDVDFDDEEGGPGGFVRTRSMKMRIQEERKPLAKIDGATVDVNALWEKMNTADTTLGPNFSRDEKKDGTPVHGDGIDTETRAGKTPTAEDKQQSNKYSEEMVKIKRTYKFAGEMITEEKIVPKDSAEAKLYMASENNVETVAAAQNATNFQNALRIRRPLRKVSRFDPNPTGSIKKSWEKQPAAEPTGDESTGGPKINTVEKSRLDWAAYVDQAGIKDELRTHSKAKEGFLGRMDFLDRVGAKREEERRNVRLKGL